MEAKVDPHTGGGDSELLNASGYTQRAYIWASLLRAPFLSLYSLLPFILYKDLGASSLQITLFLAAKPVAALFSVYWGAQLFSRPDLLRVNLLLATVLSYLPFVFVPFIKSSGVIIFISIMQILLRRGVMPAWMEVLKISLPKQERSQIFSDAASIAYFIGAVLPLFFAFCFDVYPESWRWGFCCVALLGLCELYFQWSIFVPMPQQRRTRVSVLSLLPGWKSFWFVLLRPWRRAAVLCLRYPHFLEFQIVFMLGGCGLMLIQPALPSFFIDVLNLSYTELAFAIAVCKGIGFVLTSRKWVYLLQAAGIFWVAALSSFVGVAFSLVLVFGGHWMFGVYVAYLLYGTLQAGSELAWHMAGPVFAKNKDSTPFSTLNLLCVGLRGLFIPFVGSFLCSILPSERVILMGGGLCFLAFVYCIVLQSHDLS